jgi:xanthine/CO dehydrogenase XdhC/CoxF family maturation factor
MNRNTRSNDPLSAARDWRESDVPVALATVVRTWGSAPRQAGSQMSINARGAFVGSVSGGCVEGAVIQEAQALLEAGSGTRLLTFGVTNEQAWEVGLACGGEVEIFVQVVE